MMDGSWPAVLPAPPRGGQTRSVRQSAGRWASSQPTAPPPGTTNLFGRAVRSQTVSLVRYCVSRTPGTSGTNGAAPTARTSRRALNARPAKTTDPVPVRCARPSTTSMPSARSTSAVSVAAIRDTASGTRDMAVQNGSWASEASIRFLDGTQPCKSGSHHRPRRSGPTPPACPTGRPCGRSPSHRRRGPRPADVRPGRGGLTRPRGSRPAPCGHHCGAVVRRRPVAGYRCR